MIARHGGGALALWAMHVTDRLSGPKGHGPFASEPWWEYVPTLLAQALPWTPLAIAGSYRSLRRALTRLAAASLARVIAEAEHSFPRSSCGRSIALGVDRRPARHCWRWRP